MEKVYKWVDKYNANPTAQQVCTAKHALDNSRFQKFLDITGYIPRKHKKKADRLIEIEAMEVNESLQVSDLKKDMYYISRINNDFQRLYFIRNSFGVNDIF